MQNKAKTNTKKNVHFVIINERLCTYWDFSPIQSFFNYRNEIQTAIPRKKIVDRLNSKSLKNINITIHE